MPADRSAGAHALDLAAAGWHVFPLSPSSKRPVFAHGCAPSCRGECGGVGHGFYDATTDLATVARWWAEHPRALIAARVPRGLVLLDSDPRHTDGVDALTGVCDLPATVEVESGRGDGGRHRYYVRPAGAIDGRRLPRGVDLKLWESGYAIVPPSRHPATGKPYRWSGVEVPVPCPGALAALLRTPPRPARPSRPERHGGDVRLAPLCDAVAHAVEGNRNAVLYWAACRAHADGFTHATADAALVAAALGAGLDEREARSTVRSAYAGGAR